MQQDLLSTNIDLTESATRSVVYCPSCNAAEMWVFYETKGVPVHSVLNMPTLELALTYPKGDIALGFCKVCGHISNVSFDSTLLDYSSDYEETQGFSPTFNSFHRDLATRLIEQYDLHNKDVIEIGCGKGEFLTLLCELGPNRGVGFDPAYVPERHQSEAMHRMRFVRDLYSEKYSDYQGDFVCCKMTLEHIHPVAEFIGTVRRSIGGRLDTVVFFQIPDVTRILREQAFWDIYYEHCSYFSLGSLARLFRRYGFDVIDLATEYDDQYLMIEARPSAGEATTAPLPQEEDVQELERHVTHFSQNYQRILEAWQRRLYDIHKSGRRAVLWGGGSKGVAFLTTLGIHNEIEYIVDINPHKHGMYMAGSGQQIVAPAFLREYQPDVVIVMNPIYWEEIQQDLTNMGLTAEVVTV